MRLEHSRILLIKSDQAFLLARETPEFQSRIQTIFFLGTPHRGSKYAKILSRILSLSGSSSPNYVKDLELHSVATQVLNDDFSKQAHDIHIYSFYETKEMKLGVTSGIVVPRNSAILGKHFIIILVSTTSLTIQPTSQARVSRTNEFNTSSQTTKKCVNSIVPRTLISQGLQMPCLGLLKTY